MTHLAGDTQRYAELAAVQHSEKVTWHLRAVANGLLPPLAWVADVDRTHGLVNLVHGPRVEVREHFFIEGVWDGPFQIGEFGTTDCVFGSGGLLTEDSIRFVPSAATTDYLFYDEDGEHVTVSNSLPLLLAYTGDRLDPRCPDYPTICHSILHGIHDYRRDIPTTGGTVRRLMYRNLAVSREKISESEKRMPPRFTSFAEYRDYLRDRYAQIAANARDGARTWPLQIVSTQSKGYDTTAVNTLARASGIDKVFTVSTAKSKRSLAHQEEENLPDDDGGEICATLGLPSIRLNRRAFAEGFDQEYLYYCALHHNQDANLMDIRKHLSTVSLLLTGVLGELCRPKADIVEWPCLNADLRHGDLGGSGMAEWRLVVGLIHLPLLYIGARRRADIVEITESAEMDPWRLGTAYDRPISRRIAEEAGVPRQLFGQSKMGSVVIFSRPSIPYGKALRLEFFDYLADEKIMARSKAWLWPIVRWVNSMLLVKSERRFAVVHYAERVISKLTRREFHFKLMWSKLDGALFCFCVNRTAKTYFEQLSRVKKPLNTTRTDSGDIARRDKCSWNPLSVDPVASRFSSYAAFQDEAVVRPLVPDVPVDAELTDAHDQLRQQIFGDYYPCVGAISAFARKGYRFGLFPELACDSAVRAVCHDLYEFCHEFPIIDDQLITFIAMFRGPAIESAQHFEDLLWSQLQAMHAIDSDFFAWDKSVDSDPKNNNFSFSIGGRAMYVIGMHPKASRLARTVRYPTLVFNLHEQFERLRARGKFETMKQIIRAREMAFQGSINPMLTNFGESSEARQYSGQAVPDSWSCPFHAHKKHQT